MKPLQKTLSTTQIIALGFFSAILIGTLLLMLPISSANGKATPLIDALFTATTSVCVTGLVVVPTCLHWSLFGKIIILILIQLGGLGIISFTTAIMMIIGKKITLGDRLLLEDALNLNTLSGLVAFLQKIFKWTFLVEGVGAICYTFVFIPQYGFLHGIWFAIFHSVSAFCNAGIDLLGSDSLAQYLTNPWINFVTMALIILGGIGYIVWDDILRIFSKMRQKKLHPSQCFQRLHLHTKLVLLTTGILILLGTIGIFFLEYTNEDTIGNLNFFEKLLASLFQSVTTRTAGFLTFSQANMRGPTVLICIFLMFIGGSSIGTAGGIKTTTFAALVLSALSTIKGQKHLVVFHKTIPHKTVQKAFAVTFVSFFALCTAIVALAVVENGSLTDIAYEAASAIATVGLSRDYTNHLHFAGKAIIILCMYLGRIGPISMAIAFSSREKPSGLTYPHEDITVG